MSDGVPNRKTTDRLVGGAVWLAAFAGYLATLSVGAFPGDSARTLAVSLGLIPSVAPAHPLWNCAAWLIQRLPFGEFIQRMNLFSALCGATSALLLYRLVSGVIIETIELNVSNKSRCFLAARLGGVVSALALASCVPFWVVSNRAHVASLDVLLLLWTAWLIFRCFQSARIWYAWLFAFVYCMCIVESATLLIFGVMLWLALFFAVWRSEELNAGVVLGIVLCALAGLSLYFVTAWAFYRSPGYEFRGYTGYFNLVRIMMRDQLLSITHSLPPRGWLTVLVVSAGPWLTSLAVASRGLNEEKDWTYYLLHSVLAAIGAAVLVNAKIAPWRICGFERMLVAPYVLTACTWGYLAAYSFLLPWTFWRGGGGGAGNWMKRLCGATFAAPFLALVCVMPFRNLEEADGRPARYAGRFAEEVVNSLSCPGETESPERAWLVTHGILDDNIRLVAHSRGMNLKVLNLRGAGNEIYVRYIASLLEAPRLRNLAQLGLLPLVQGWIEWDPDADRKLAIFAVPDLWVGAGCTVVPNKLLFLGARKDAELNVEKLLAGHRRFWDANAGPMRDLSNTRGPLAGLGEIALRHMSVVANNLGVLMEDRGGRDDAYTCYIQARELCTNNISALLNLSTMMESGYRSDRAEQVKEELAKLTGDDAARSRMWALSRYYGYVRRPEAFAGMGWTWALSGQPGLAVSGFKKALDLVPEGEQGRPIKQALAGLYFMGHQDESSEELYSDILRENPSDIAALLGSARLAAKRGDWNRAKPMLEQAEKAGVSRVNMALEWALFHLMSGDKDRARIILEEVVDLHPELVKAQGMLVWTLVLQRDIPGLEERARKIEGLSLNRSSLPQIARGHLALLRGNWDEARKSFEKALAITPNDIRILEVLLRLDIGQAREELARSRALAILRLDAGHALANYALGSIQLKNREYALAEDSLRRSVKRERTWEALNDLAWLLQKRRNYDEAEQFARASLQIDDKMFNAWDTLGVVLMRKNDLDSAEQALEKALSMRHDNPVILVHMAEVCLLKGDKQRAKSFIEVPLKEREKMSLEEQDLLDNIAQTIGSD